LCDVTLRFETNLLDVLADDGSAGHVEGRGDGGQGRVAVDAGSDGLEDFGQAELLELDVLEKVG